MISIGIGEIQKNTAIFTNMKEVFQVVDKRKKRTLATVYPVHQHNVVSSLAGKYKDRVVTHKEMDMQQIKELAMKKAMEEKYCLSS